MPITRQTAALLLIGLALFACAAKPAADGGVGQLPAEPSSAGAAGTITSDAGHGATPATAGGGAGFAAGTSGQSTSQSGVSAGRAGASAQQAGAAGSTGASGTRAGAVSRDAGTPDAMANDAATPPTAATIAQPSELHGVNWADTRDNFVRGLLQLSGLDSEKDSYDTVKAKTSDIVGQFRDVLGANTIRIPINEPTVASPWWNSYKAVIDSSTALGVNVIVAYWAASGGKPQDEAAFKSMWQTVVAAYPDNNRVFFDIHNEPSGFSASAWKDEAAGWLSSFPMLPRGRVIIAGIGSDGDVVPIGSDSRFDGCILQLHYYEFWHKDWTMQKQWRDAIKGALGSYASRTIVGEWGAEMASGLDYNTKTPDGTSSIAYISAMADLIRENSMGSCYWPGLRDGDSYSLLKRAVSSNATTLTVVNQSGRDRLRWAWHY